VDKGEKAEGGVAFSLGHGRDSNWEENPTLRWVVVLGSISDWEGKGERSRG